MEFRRVFFIGFGLFTLDSLEIVFVVVKCRSFSFLVAGSVMLFFSSLSIDLWSWAFLFVCGTDSAEQSRCFCEFLQVLVFTEEQF